MTSQTAEPRTALRVVEPKLMAPRIQPRMLRRGRLTEMLAREGTTFTLVSAPVGYGKTTLLRTWCIERPEPVAWVSLDAADDDPVRLWTHLAAAVDRIDQGVAGEALERLGVRGAKVATAIDDLMNGLVAYEDAVTIVIDDLHAVRSEASLRSMRYALEGLPTNVRLLAATRSDPGISLSRLRALGELTEIRARHLAFTLEEARELLEREGLGLPDESVKVLVERTEGWPAGLYLAALWLRDHDDPKNGVRAFAGSTRQLGDYLTDEVVASLAPETRDFLVRTSVLGRFTPELCNAVLGREDSASVLADLAQANMFLVALDAREEWYRYHHLFSEVLRLELGREQAEELRRCAARWCRVNGLVEDALEYAADAGDAEMVAELLLENDRELVWTGRTGQFLRWVRWLPSDLLVRHPSLLAAGAICTVLLSRPDVEAQRLLALADRARRTNPQRWSPYVEALVEVARATLFERGDAGASVDHARRALAAAREGAEVLSVGILATLSQSLFFAGDLDESRRVALEAIERPDALEVSDGYVAAVGLLALIEAERGHTESAEAWASEAIGFARKRFQADLWTASPAHLALALTYAATGRLDEAEREASRGEQLRRSRQPTIPHTHALLVLAQVRLARSRITRALGDLERGRRALAGFVEPGRLPAIVAAVERGIVDARAAAGSRGILEQPSPAELAVLRELAAGLSRREIGEHLYISLNTVKTHVRELYRKLGATSRTDAIARADALGLLDAEPRSRVSESPG